MALGPMTLPLRFSLCITFFKATRQFKFRGGAPTSPYGLTSVRCCTKAGVGGTKPPLLTGVSLAGGGGVVKSGVWRRVGTQRLAVALV